MPSNRFTTALGLLIFTTCMGAGADGAGRQHSNGQGRNGRHLTQGRPSLDDLLTRLDSSIHEHTTRLQRGLPTTHYRTDISAVEHDEGPTIIHGSWDDDDEGTTQLEGHDDTADYVNAAPWTRGPHQGSNLQAHDLQKIRLASDNARWVKDNGKCKVPLRRCVPVASHTSDVTLQYWPRCALIHRCGDDAGCCNALDHTCAMAESENIDLYFYVYNSTRVGVQKMTFANHTRCSCQSKSAVVAQPTAAETPTQCTCPKHFTPMPSNGNFGCDCVDGKSNCRKYKRGKRYFSGQDIKCISTGECCEPVCEYGPFLLTKRRCTKRREREHYVTNRK